MEVGWHLRFSRESELAFIVQGKLAPNVEDAVFIAGGWTLEWAGPPDAEGLLTARVRRGGAKGGAAE